MSWSTKAALLSLPVTLRSIWLIDIPITDASYLLSATTPTEEQLYNVSAQVLSSESNPQSCIPLSCFNSSSILLHTSLFIFRIARAGYFDKIFRAIFMDAASCHTLVILSLL